MPESEAQKAWLEAIRKLTLENGCPPTLRELCAEMGHSSTNAACDMLARLEKLGSIRRVPGKARGVHLVASGGVCPVCGQEVEDM